MGRGFISSAFSFALFIFCFNSFALAHFSQELSYKPKAEYFEVEGGVESFYNRSENQSVVRLGFQGERALGNLKFFGEGTVLLQSFETEQFFWTLPEFYIQKNIGQNGQIFFGRKILNFSDNQILLPAGFWNNAWDFRKDLPREEGMLGITYEWQARDWGFSVFASPVAVPKLTSHQEFSDDGDVLPLTPWFGGVPNEVSVSGSQFPLRYTLGEIDYVDIAFSPQIAGSLWKKWSRSQIRFNYSYGPSKDLDLGLSFLVDATQENLPVDLVIEPSVAYVHKFGLEYEVLFNSRSSIFLNASGQYRPQELNIDQDRSNIGTSSGMFAFLGYKYDVGPLSSNVFVYLGNTVDTLSNGELDQVVLDALEVHPRFQRGIGVESSFKLSNKMRIQSLVYFDQEDAGAFGKLELERRVSSNLFLTLGAGFVEVFSQDSTGFYRDFSQNDQIYSRMNYVF